ncbi:MAG: phosphoribosylaminoimidazolesuccinocarboxamide synthase [Oscillospiraceae bacterium]|nr:phosphoribosylaminoimidazolesuccinocarboxamide synthase [Oscillospiraceae bacterium]
MTYKGKSKVIQPGDTTDTLRMTFTDNVTAFNGEKSAAPSGKGAVCAAISHLIYRYLAVHGIETHLVSEIDSTTALVKKAKIVPIEIIVRNLAAGGFSKKYGVAEGTQLAHPTVEFSVKSDELGDPMINKSQITAIGLATESELDAMIAQSEKINLLLTELFAKARIKLADFKLEFGNSDGKIILCDEISPDSCRLWDMDTEQKLDKDVFRRDLGDVIEVYSEVLRRLENVI